MNTLSAGPAAAGLMDGVYEWGIQVIQMLQDSLPGFMLPLFRLITFLGDSYPYIFILVLIYWCVDERRAARIAGVLFVSAGINLALKTILAVPRPFYRHPGLNKIPASGFSTPSGHAQNSAAFWPYVLHPAKSRLFRIALPILLTVLIGLSRVYLGVHYPTDVLLGWLLGGTISVAALYAAPRLYRLLADFFQKRFPNAAPPTVRVKIAGVAAAAFAVNCFSGSDTQIGGLLFGFSSGYILLRDAQSSGEIFSAASGSILKKILRMLAGLTGAAIVYMFLNALGEFAGNDYLALSRFIKYAGTGFWISRVAPAVFVRIGLQ